MPGPKFLYFAGMKNLLPAAPVIFLALVLASACSGGRREPVVSENNVDAARNFIRAALDGRFDEARKYMLTDSLNTNYMDVAERAYQRSDKTVKEGYRAASINIREILEPVRDSVTIVIYSNSYRNDPDTLRIIRKNGEWLVDLKYLFEHDSDTLLKRSPVNDTKP